MISERREPASAAFVWIWLPQQTEPVVAGRIEKREGLLHFTYGRSYRERADAIPFSPVELPLQPGTFSPTGMHEVHSSLRDAAPDAWGRRVVGHRYPGLEVGELDYMLLSGSDRIGALDFQERSDEYVPRDTQSVELEQLLEAARLVEERRALPPELDLALLHGTSVGGARPKALVRDGEKHLIAKFSSSTDSYDVVKAEFVSMRLAARAGLHVAPVSLRRVLGRDVLLVERFDRVHASGGVERRHVLSVLGLLGLHEMEARYASYRDLADLIRHRFDQPGETLRELFRRLVFNILVGNTDDHARNHAAFWDGQSLRLTPAYDLCPQRRSGREASQAMAIGGVHGNLSTLANAVSIADAFQLGRDEATDIAQAMLQIVREGWSEACEEAGLGEVERERLMQSTVLNPFCFLDWPHGT